MTVFPAKSRPKDPSLRIFFLLALSLVLAWLALPYLRLPYNPLFLFPFSFILFAAQRVCLQKHPDKKQLVFILPFSVVLSLCLVVSKHLVVTPEDPISPADQNYLSAFSHWDGMAFFILCYLLCVGLQAAFFTCLPAKEDTVSVSAQNCTIPVVNKKMFAFAVLLFVAWLPYFVLYYPGLVYGDSLESMKQALHITEYYNHHPIFYTLFIQLCLSIGRSVADVALGCAIYTIIQMIFLALVFAYCACWLRSKGISRTICLGVLLVYAFMACYPQHAISMWKDPAFSAGLLLYSLKLVDLIQSHGRLASDRRFCAQSSAILVLICLSRSNGVYIVLLSLLCLLCIAFFKKQLPRLKRLLLVHIACTLGILLLTGPVYTLVGIRSDAVESFSIPLQQVARVIVYDGALDDGDRTFLNTLLPLERWKEVYRPGLVDPIKWDGSFNKEFFNENRTEFIKVWFRTLLKNPRLYLEAWCLNTYGYWAPTVWEYNNYSSNISFGNLQTVNDCDPSWGLTPQYLMGNEAWKELFSLFTPYPSSGLLTWVILFMVLFAFVRGKALYALLFLPSIGNFLTLLIASPHVYWPRYTLVYIYLLPIVVLFPSLLQHCPSQREATTVG